MHWWYWIIGGLVLAAIELATPGGFFVIFFAIAAVVVGLLDAAGLVRVAWLQWLLFSVVAIAGLGLFRRPLLDRMGMGMGVQTPMDTLIGEVAIATSNIQPGEHGRAELRGSGWSARNVGPAALAIGQRCRVVAVQGLMLDLRQE